MIRVSRFFFLFVLFLLFLFSCQYGVKPYKNYGVIIVDSTKAVDLNDMLLQLEQNPEKVQFTFTAQIEEVCQTAGCWVTVKKKNGDCLRVRFKDHFLIPKNTRKGSIAYFDGVAYWDTLSVELQRHFAVDEKKTNSEINKINKPKYELNFEANGILVEDVEVSQK